MMTEAATAAFSDSIPGPRSMGMKTFRSQAAITAPESPWPSFPITNISLFRTPASCSGTASDESVVPSIRLPAAASRRSADGRSAVMTILREKTAPIAALSTRGL